MREAASGKLHSRKGVFAAAMLLGVLFLAPFIGFSAKTAPAPESGASAGNARFGGMVRLKTYVAEHEIPNRYLFIGTYLIDSSVITPQYYDLAQKSMRSTGQNNQLYKSELAGGAWRDITPGGIDSIRPGGANAGRPGSESGEDGGAGSQTDSGTSGNDSGTLSDEDIGNSMVSCVIAEDGIARDPMTGEIMDVFGNPYNLMDLDELKPLVDKFSALYNDAERNEVEEQHIYLTQMALGDPEGQYATIMPRLDMNEVTTKSDARLKTLRSQYYEVFLQEDKPGQAAQIMKIMESEDAKRKMEVFRLLAVNGDDSRLSMLSRLISEGASFSGDMESFEPEQDYLDAIEKSTWNCRGAYDGLRTKVIQRRTGVVGENRFTLSERITALADEQPDATAEEAVECATKLFYLDNIENGVIKELQPEWEYCVELVSEAHKIYSELARGGNYEYAAPEVNPDLRDEYLGIYYSLLEQARGELQKLIEAKVLREKALFGEEGGDESMLRYLAAEMNLNALLLDSAKDTGIFREYIESSLNTHASWLQAMYDRIKGAAGGDNGEEKKEKEALQEAYDRAVDDEDYARARELELELADYDAVSDASGDGGEREDFSEYLPDGGNGETFRNNLAALLDGMLSVGDTSLLNQIAKELSDRGDTSNMDGIMKSVIKSGQSGDLARTVGEYRDAAAGNRGKPLSQEQPSDNEADQTGQGESSETGVTDLEIGAEDSSETDEPAQDGGDGSDDSGKGNENMRNATGKGKMYVAPKNTDNTPSSLSDNEINSAIEDALGGPFSGLSQDAKAAVVAALNIFGLNHEDSGCLNYGRKLLSIIMREQNVLVYTQYKHNRIYELISLGVIDKARSYTGYRWVSIGGEESLAACGTVGKDGVMGGIRFTVQVGERRIVMPDGMKLEMGLVVNTQQDHYLDTSGETYYPYLDEEVTRNFLNIDSEYIDSTDYAVVLTEKMHRIVDKLVKTLEERIRS